MTPLVTYVPGRNCYLCARNILNFDKPWEGNTSFYVNILKDDDRYRMYYRGSNSPDYVQKSLLEPGETVAAHHPFTISYAESKDGIHWERPDLGIYEFEGSKANSIVWMDKPGDQEITACMYVFKDGNPASPASQRYKAVGGSSLSVGSPCLSRWAPLDRTARTEIAD